MIAPGGTASMGSIRRKKCRHCGKLFVPDARNAKRQKYCGELACRKASKAASQQQWLQKPQNRDYFRSPENVARVQQWRRDNPGYWRRGRPKAHDALQDPLIAKPLKIIEQSGHFAGAALQDSLIMQPAVLIGLISNFTGCALQDDIANILKRLQQLGADIINASQKGEHHDCQTPYR